MSADGGGSAETADLGDLVSRIRNSAPRPVVLVDGRSGVGKSTVAGELAATLSAQLVHLDDLYPGWDGLEAGSQHVLDNVLATSEPRWRRWDWVAMQPAEWHDLDPTLPLVVEGSAALTRANRAHASFGIWIELDDATRMQRALERDAGDLDYERNWDRWAAQEAAFILRENPRSLADAVVER